MVRVPLSSKAPDALYIFQKLKQLCGNSFKLSIFMDLDSDLPDSVRSARATRRSATG